MSADPPPPPGDDLDALIGDIEHEAARRRAEPGYPHDRDLAVRRQLDDLSPGRGTAPDELIKAVLLAIGDRTGDPATARRPWPPTAPAVTAALQALGERIDELASATATALSLLFDRDEPPAPPAGADPLAGWGPVLAPPPGSPTVVVAPPGDHLASVLLPDGATVQNVRSPTLDPDVDVVVVRPTRADLDGGLPNAFGRAASVALVSPAPWWWRITGMTAGEVTAPATAEAWLEALHAVGFTATARYDAEGRTYLVRATRT